MSDTKKPEQRGTQILLSKRANVFYLEHARVMVKDERIIYLTEYKKGIDRAFNLPDKNTAFLLLGKGTSLTDAAARKLAESNVMVGFCGSGGSPLFSITDFTFLEPQSEYRPTGYMQSWVGIWMDEHLRLESAKYFLTKRIKLTLDLWDRHPDLQKATVKIGDRLVKETEGRINSATNTGQLLSAEGDWAKKLYGILARSFKIDSFSREEGKGSREDVPDVVNGFLDHGNYIAYGYAAVALHALGISFAMPLLHGKTRRGALVFDVADLIKDALIMPAAFSMGVQRARPQEFRNDLMYNLQKTQVVDLLIETLVETIEKFGNK
jgi:CRISPR-associated protein Cas1